MVPGWLDWVGSFPASIARRHAGGHPARFVMVADSRSNPGPEGPDTSRASTSARFLDRFRRGLGRGSTDASSATASGPARPTRVDRLLESGLFDVEFYTASAGREFESAAPRGPALPERRDAARPLPAPAARHLLGAADGAHRLAPRPDRQGPRAPGVRRGLDRLLRPAVLPARPPVRRLRTDRRRDRPRAVPGPGRRRHAACRCRRATGAPHPRSDRPARGSPSTQRASPLRSTTTTGAAPPATTRRSPRCARRPRTSRLSPAARRGCR